MKKLIACCLVFESLSALGPVGKCAVEINEVLANEPGSAVSLEWLELFNDSAQSVTLDTYQMVVDGMTLDFPAGEVIGANEYAIVCRRLLADSTTLGFESVWGDSSGLWGDTQAEANQTRPIEMAIKLRNSFGIVELLLSGSVVSSFGWSDAGADGTSWERIDVASDSIAQSRDPSGSTPGQINSQTPVPFDLGIESVLVEPVPPMVRLTFTIVNWGFETATGRQITLQSNDSGSSFSGDSLPLPSTDPGDTVQVQQVYEFEGVHVHLLATLDDDDRTANNNLSFVATGDEYPPLVLLEVLADPEVPLQSEWVELFNRSAEAVDLNNWQIGDWRNTHAISNSTLLLEPGSYAILAECASCLFTFYDLIGSLVIAEPGGWSSLNNSGDTVLLIDDFGIEADRFAFDNTFGDNYTWGRVSEYALPGIWGQSDSPGGTPGAENIIVLSSEASSTTVAVSPTHIVTDGSSTDDRAIIELSFPPAESYTLRIYDSSGRIVRSFADNASIISNNIDWDGRSDAGSRLPVGIYIVYFEASGAGSDKTTLVIAR